MRRTVSTAAWRYHEAPCGITGLAGAWSWQSVGIASALFPVPPDGCSDVVWRETPSGVWHARLLPPTTRGFFYPVRPGERLRGVRLLPGQVQALFGVKPGAMGLDGIDLGVGFRLQTPKPYGWEEQRDLALNDCIVQVLMAGMGPCEVAERLGLHSRTLRRRMQDVAGCSPKELQRMWRLRRAIYSATKTVRPDWSDVAGFTDQSHLIRECQSLMDGTPVEIHHLMRQGRMSVSYNTPAAQPS